MRADVLVECPFCHADYTHVVTRVQRVYDRAVDRRLDTYFCDCCGKTATVTFTRPEIFNLGVPW